MPNDFVDITIVALDPERSFPRSGVFWTKVFTLSAAVPAEWNRLFDEVWDGARYNPKRHARIEENAILTICVLEDLEGQHMDFLHAAVAHTNDAYRAYLAGAPS